MSDINIEKLDLIKLSKAKDGDLLVISSDDLNESLIKQLKEAVAKYTNAKLLVLGMPTGDDIKLVEASEAKAILEAIAKGQ